MKKLYIGDCKIRPKNKKVVYIDKLSINRVRVNSFIPVLFIIDLDSMRVDKKKLRELLKSDADIICRTGNEDKAGGLFNLFDKVIYNGGDVKIDLFKILEAIFVSPDRDRVFDILCESKLPARLLLKWIISNIAMDDEENMQWVQIIDIYNERISPILIWRMISLFDPGYSKGKRFYYNFGKGEH